MTPDVTVLFDEPSSTLFLHITLWVPMMEGAASGILKLGQSVNVVEELHDNKVFVAVKE
jgi:hypothetical protein